MRLSACIEWLFAEEQDFAARVGRAAAVGLPAVEFWEWRVKDLDALAAATDAAKVEVTCFCCDPPGQLIDPTAHAAFLDGLQESIEVAKRLRCGQLIVVAGDLDDEAGHAGEAELAGEVDHAAVAEHWAALREGLRAAAEIAARAEIVLLLEPLNTRLDHPHHFLDSTEQALALIETLGTPSVRLLLDLYHSHMMGEPGLQTLLGGRESLLGHVHVADAPGRIEPGTGEIDWKRALDELRRLGYDGAIGLEYMPSEVTEQTLRRAHDALGL